MNSVTHIAGYRATIDGKCIQRCSWCGVVLIDTRRQMGVVGPSGEVPEPALWEPGRLVRVTSGFPEVSEMLSETDKLPPDNCADALERAERAQQAVETVHKMAVIPRGESCDS